ncbi:MAG: hypothetical protein J6K21_02740 [Bacilli bacterium]|nr:hypothetical protein [Bacilli bacterium]
MVNINSEEIKIYLENRDYELSIEEFIYITSSEEHNVINRVLYNQYLKCFEMWTTDNFYFSFNIKKEKEKKKSLI